MKRRWSYIEDSDRWHLIDFSLIHAPTKVCDGEVHTVGPLLCPPTVCSSCWTEATKEERAAIVEITCDTQ